MVETLVGVGFGTAFYKWMVDRSGEVRAIAYMSRLVVLADWLFTTPAIILQPLTGLWMLQIAGFSLSSTWILATLLLASLSATSALALPTVSLSRVPMLVSVGNGAI